MDHAAALLPEILRWTSDSKVPYKFPCKKKYPKCFIIETTSAVCTIEIVVFAYMYYVWTVIFLNALPNKKILEASESKAFAEDKMNLALMMVYVFDRAQNITVKG